LLSTPEGVLHKGEKGLREREGGRKRNYFRFGLEGFPEGTQRGRPSGDRTNYYGRRQGNLSARGKQLHKVSGKGGAYHLQGDPGLFECLGKQGKKRVCTVDVLVFFKKERSRFQEGGSIGGGFPSAGQIYLFAKKSDLLQFGRNRKLS